jgi:hypothetical protein
MSLISSDILKVLPSIFEWFTPSKEDLAIGKYYLKDGIIRFSTISHYINTNPEEYLNVVIVKYQGTFTGTSLILQWQSSSPNSEGDPDYHEYIRMSYQ